MKTNGRARVWRVAALVLAVLWGVGVPLFAQEISAVDVQAAVSASGVRLEAHAGVPFEYSTYRASDSLYVVEMTGVTLEGNAAPRVLNSDVVSGYRLLPYRAMGRSVVRMEILLRHPVGPRVERVNSKDLVITFDAAASASASSPAPRVAPEALPAPRPVSAKRSAPVVASPASGGHAVIESVSLNRANGDVVVFITASSKLNYQALHLAKPERLVLDFNGATVGRLSKPGSLADPVAGIRAAQFKPDMARVVIDLDHSATYQITPQATGLEVIFPAKAAEQHSAEPVALNAAAPAAEAPAAGSFKAQPVEPTTAPAPVAEPVQVAKAPEVATVTPSQPKGPAPILVSTQDASSGPAVTVDSAGMPLPKSLTDENVALAAPRKDGPDTPGNNPTTPAASAAAPAAAPATPEPASAAAAEPLYLDPAQGSGAKKYSGEPISVNLKDVDLKDFFRLIHEISGLNIVLDPTVRGTLTLVLDDVPWDQALDIVLQNNSLDKQLTGNVLRIATKDTLKKEAETARDLAKAQTEAVPSVTATRQLSYAKASTLRDTLKRFLTSRGDILADDRANVLIIRDIPAVFPDLDALIKTLDQKSQQVEIEARVVSATRSFDREIGVQFGLASSATNGRNIFGGLPGNPSFVSPIVRNSPPLPVPPLTATGSNAIPLITNLGANAPNTGVSYIFSSTNVAVDLIISAAEDRGIGKLLSRPKIVTQNNVAGTVKQGTKIPVQTVINNTISTQFFDAVLQLTVTPQITKDGTIFMTIAVENDQPDFSHQVQGIPSIITQSADTKVLANDGGTVVIGGVIVSSQNTTINQTPLFGSIPIIGNLFKHTLVSTSSTELLFFITPRIIPT